MNFNHISWENPTLGNEPDFQIMADNDIQLVRIWLSEWGIYGSGWNPWNSPHPEQHGQYMPYTGLSFEQAFPGSDLSMKLRATANPCMFGNFMKAPFPVKRNTTYRVRIRYKTEDLVGPRIAGNPYGLVAKTGDWLWGSGYYCYDPRTGDLVTPHQDQNTTDWQILEGSLNSGERDQ